jgi:hypothetical protein
MLVWVDKRKKNHFEPLFVENFWFFPENWLAGGIFLRFVTQPNIIFKNTFFTFLDMFEKFNSHTNRKKQKSSIILMKSYQKIHWFLSNFWVLGTPIMRSALTAGIGFDGVLAAILTKNYSLNIRQWSMLYWLRPPRLQLRPQTIFWRNFLFLGTGIM